MNKRINVFFRVPLLYLASITVMIGIFVWKMSVLPPQIPLFYSRPNSEQQVVHTYYIFILPAIGFFMILLNSLFGNKVIKDDFAKSVTFVQNIFIVGMISYIFVKILLLIA